MPLKPGKVPPDLLKLALEKLEVSSEDILIGPRYGVDGAIVKVKNPHLALTSDPITFTSKDSVYYLMACNINDLISMGARPLYLSVNLLFYEGATEEEVLNTFEELGAYSKKFNVSVITGHTEVTPGLKSTILSGFMVGQVVREVSPEKIRVGDVIVQVKGVAIEGTSIISREKQDELVKVFGEPFVKRCQDFLYDPGICLFDVGIKLIENYEIHNLHDPTEGGIVTALFESIQASGLGAFIDGDRIIIYSETKKLSEHYRIDPLGLIASGSLIVFTEKREAERICDDLRRENIPAEIIGEVREKEADILIKKQQVLKKLAPFERDQILEVLG
ncbi:MAG: AIR synthase-related protein [bacterium]|nr:AIR synthase-related protein [bacterium]